jgi:hypothetical protein
MQTWHREQSTYSYEILWRAALSALKSAQSRERVREDHLAIHALLSGFLAFEGFLNFVGEEIAPKIWEDERAFFSRAPYRGIVGKIEYLFTLFDGALLKKGEDPYQAFYKIKKIRDSLAHNRVLRYKEVTENEVPSFKTYWDDFDTPEKVAPALEQLKLLAEIIRVEALKLLDEEYQLSHLHFPAFEGPLAHAEGTTRA